MGIHQPISGYVIAKVIESKSNTIHEGDIVKGTLPWATYCIENAEEFIEGGCCQRFSQLLSWNSGNVGLHCLFRNDGYLQTCRGETAVISRCSRGCWNNRAGQIAKTLGLRVIGITGTDEK